MFDKKYSTSTVAAQIDLDIQLLLWKLIDDLKIRGYEMDYLQVFELYIIETRHGPLQKVIHRQEVPARKHEMMFAVEKPINSRLWIVDNGDEEGNAVMMYPSEY